MGYCKDCRYWGAWKDGVCDRVGDLHTKRTPESGFDIEAGAADDTGLTADLITGPLFGCVQFVKKTVDTE